MLEDTPPKISLGLPHTPGNLGDPIKFMLKALEGDNERGWKLHGDQKKSRVYSYRELVKHLSLNPTGGTPSYRQRVIDGLVSLGILEKGTQSLDRGMFASIEGDSYVININLLKTFKDRI